MNIQGFFISMIVPSSMVQAAFPEDKQEIVVVRGHKWVVIKKLPDGTIVVRSLRGNLKGFFTPEFLKKENLKK